MSDARQRDPTRLVKDVLGIFGHSKANTTVNVSMQELEEGIKQKPDAIYAEPTATPGGAEGEYNFARNCLAVTISLSIAVTVSPRRSAAMTTLESRISPMRAGSTAHDGC